MNDALNIATMAIHEDEVPVGAVIVNANGMIIASAHNKVITDKDPTAHAEILAIRKASKLLNSQYLINCDIYVTLEPCAMCAYAISISRLRKLYFGAFDTKSGGVENGARVLHNKACHHKPEIYGGISERESQILLHKFFKKRKATR